MDWFVQVNAKAAGKAAIHCASAAGNVDVIKCLLEFSPDLEVEVRININYTFVHTTPGKQSVLLWKIHVRTYMNSGWDKCMRAPHYSEYVQ